MTIISLLKMSQGIRYRGRRRAFDPAINLVCDCGKHHKWAAPGGALGAALARPDVTTVSCRGRDVDGPGRRGLLAIFPATQAVAPPSGLKHWPVV